MSSRDLSPAFEALDRCDTALKELSDQCCEPGRSPRMERLGETLTRGRSGLELIGEDSDKAGTVIAELEDAGAQLGWLQVGCCAPSRMPLYAAMLTDLMKAQRAITREHQLGH